MDIPDIAIGAIVASVISSIAALLGLIISKENKTSEFRQKWIDELRGDVAGLIAHLDSMRTTLRLSGGGSSAWEQERENVIFANTHLAQIRLRLNPREKDSAAVMRLLAELERLYKPQQAFDWIRMEAIENELLVATKAVLKAEWNRVRDGERVFRLARFGFFGFLLFGILALGASVWQLANH